MALNIRQDLADQLQKIADREHRTVDDVLQDLLAHYQPPTGKESIRLPDPNIDPFEAMCGMFDDPITDLSETVRETMEEFYRKRYGTDDCYECVARIFTSQR